MTRGGKGCHLFARHGIKRAEKGASLKWGEKQHSHVEAGLKGRLLYRMTLKHRPVPQLRSVGQRCR